MDERAVDAAIATMGGMTASEPLFLKPTPQTRLFPVQTAPPPERTYWGLRSPHVARELHSRYRLSSVGAPAESFFSHTTAAAAHGIPLPARLSEDPRLHVTVQAPRGAPRGVRGRRLIGHSLRMPDVEVIRAGEVRVTSVERTWCDLAGLLTMPELVAAGDYLIHWKGPMSTQYMLAEQVGYLRNRRYVRLLRAAVLALDARSDSPAESQLRVLCAMVGLLDPGITRSVPDDYGEFVGVTTLFFESAQLVVRYWGDGPRAPGGTEGAHHEVIDGTTWMVLDVVGDDLADPRGFVRRAWRYGHRPITPR